MIETDGRHPRNRESGHSPPRFARSLLKALRFARLATVSVLGVIALLVNSAIAFYALQQVREGAERVDHTRVIRREIYQLQITMTDAETGQRGFLLTGDAGYLEPYRNKRGV